MSTTRQPGYWRNILYMLGQEQAEIRDDIRRETASLRAGTQEAIARSKALLAKTGADENRRADREAC